LISLRNRTVLPNKYQLLWRKIFLTIQIEATFYTSSSSVYLNSKNAEQKFQMKLCIISSWSKIINVQIQRFPSLFLQTSVKALHTCVFTHLNHHIYALKMCVYNSFYVLNIKRICSCHHSIHLWMEEKRITKKAIKPSTHTHTHVVKLVECENYARKWLYPLDLMVQPCNSLAYAHIHLYTYVTLHTLKYWTSKCFKLCSRFSLYSLLSWFLCRKKTLKSAYLWYLL
jgi:hypothetical protein